MEDSPTLFTISFNKENPIYREGDDIYGKVQVDHKKEVKCKTISLELYGIATVQWTNLSSDKHGPCDKTVDGNKEVYFQKKVILYEKESAEVLNPIHRSFHFEVKLPPELPSTFEGIYGQMKYHAQLIIDNGTGKPEVVIKKPFTIVSGLDLNFIPEAAIRIELCKHKSLTYMGKCCSSGSVTADWTIDRSGFIPGEHIEVNGAIQNDSREMVLFSKVALIMVVDYKAKKWRRKEKREVVAVEKGIAQSGEVTVWQDYLLVPPLPPTGLHRCRLIDINYELEFKAVIEGNHPPIYFQKPIYIGTVPISLRDMKSCVAGMFNQPYEESTSQWFTSHPSQISLTQIVSIGSSAVITAEPTAPTYIFPSAPELSEDYTEDNATADNKSTVGSESDGTNENMVAVTDCVSKCTEETKLVQSSDTNQDKEAIECESDSTFTVEQVQKSSGCINDETMAQTIHKIDISENSNTQHNMDVSDPVSSHLYTYYGTIGKLDS